MFIFNFILSFKIDSVFLPEDLTGYAVKEGEIAELNYPVETYPDRVEPITLEKVKRVRGILTGIRGQYLYFDHHRVINMRKYAGYQINAGYSTAGR